MVDSPPKAPKPIQKRKKRDWVETLERALVVCLALLLCSGILALLFALSWSVLLGPSLDFVARTIHYAKATARNMSEYWKASLILLAPILYRTFLALAHRIEEAPGFRFRAPQTRRVRAKDGQIPDAEGKP